LRESFRFLLRKKTLVHQVQIDAATFAIHLFDNAGQAIPKHRLSEGEKQVFAISVLWGLMTIKQIRLSSQAREQLIRLKTRTGIGQWNILCRWAFCLSLREPTPPTPIDVPADSNVEMTWPVFAGEHHELYLALLKERCHRDGVELSDKELNRQFRLHLHRGIGYLASPNTIRSIADLVRITP
jgi:DNA sulfur modification protein DndE